MSKNPVDTSFYNLLGVKPDAAETDIKQAFRKMAVKWHPDKWTNASAEEKTKAEEMFKNISEAYSVLSDAEKREKYNRFGPDIFKNGGSDHDMSADFGGIFRNMGRNFPFGNGRNKPANVRFPNLTHVIKATIADTYLGKQVVFEVTRYSLIEGQQPKKEDLMCSTCKGSGTVTELIQMGPGMMQKSMRKCSACSGGAFSFPSKFFVKEEHKFSKLLPKGVVNGERIIIENKGHEVPNCFKDQFLGQTRSNVVLVIDETPEMIVDGRKFTRYADNTKFNLEVEVKIKPHEAVCGTIIPIKFIDDKTLCVEIPRGIIFEKHNKIVVIPGSGMPYYKMKNKFGDLFVALEIDNETALSKEQAASVWNSMTGTNMKSELKKIVKTNPGEQIKAYSVREFKSSEKYAESEKLQQEFYKKMASEAQNDDSDDDNGMHGMHGMRGMNVDTSQCQQM
jgi:DnaJ-class molecular chaperone